MAQPSIAQGDFITAVRAGLFANSPARVSCGIRCDVRLNKVSLSAGPYREWDEQRSADGKFLLDRPLWVIQQGDDISRPEQLLAAKETKYIRLQQRGQRSLFPIKWTVRGVVSQDRKTAGEDRYRPVENALAAGTISQVWSFDIEILGNFIMDISKPGTGEGGNTEIKNRVFRFDFRIRVCMEKLQPRLILSISKGGIFQEN